MKKLKLLTQLIPILALAFSMVACGGSADTAQEESGADSTEQMEADTDADKQGPEYTSAYICPMHCEGSGSDEPGKCPVCGMDYVKNEDMPADGHMHDNGHDHHHEDGHDHDGHNH